MTGATLQGGGNPAVCGWRRFRSPCAVADVWFAGDSAIYVGTDGHVICVPRQGAESLAAMHGDVILASDADGRRVGTAGSDGSVRVIDASGTVGDVAAFEKHRWVTSLCLGGGSVAWTIGRDVVVRGESGAEQTRSLRSPVTAAALSPDGMELALASRDGLLLWRPSTGDERELPLSSGSAVSLQYSSDGQMIAECCYGASACIRVLRDGAVMSLHGNLPARAFSWAPDGDTLIGAGARHLTVWPLLMNAGQLYTVPRLLAPYRERVTAVAHHPGMPIAAVGYADGMVLMVRLNDGAEIILRRGGGAAVSAIRWNARGDALALGTREGDAVLAMIELQ